MLKHVLFRVLPHQAFNFQAVFRTYGNLLNWCEQPGRPWPCFWLLLLSPSFLLLLCQDPDFHDSMFSLIIFQIAFLEGKRQCILLWFKRHGAVMGHFNNIPVVLLLGCYSINPLLWPLTLNRTNMWHVLSIIKFSFHIIISLISFFSLFMPYISIWHLFPFFLVSFHSFILYF